MLLLWLIPQLQEDSEDFIFQQDGVLPRFHFNVRAHLNANLPGRWIGRIPWPPRSADLTPCDFFLMGLHQGTCVCAPYATTAATKYRGGCRCYRPPDVAGA